MGNCKHCRCKSYEGLLGGAAYVNTYYSISTEVCVCVSVFVCVSLLCCFCSNSCPQALFLNTNTPKGIYRDILVHTHTRAYAHIHTHTHTHTLTHSDRHT